MPPTLLALADEVVPGREAQRRKTSTVLGAYDISHCRAIGMNGWDAVWCFGALILVVLSIATRWCLGIVKHNVQIAMQELAVLFEINRH